MLKKIKLVINKIFATTGYSITKTKNNKEFLDFNKEEQFEYDTIKKLHGCLGSDAFKLFKNLSKLKDKDVNKALEIGVFCGRSLLGIAFAFKTTEITGVDPFFENFSDSTALENEAMYLQNKSGNTTKKQRIENIWLVAGRFPELKKRLKLKQYTQEIFLTKNTEKFNLIHIDGEHSYKAVFDIINQFKNILSSDSLVIIDDMPNPGFPEISEAVYVHPDYNKNIFPVFYGFNKSVFVYSPVNKHTLSDLKNKLYNLYNSKIYTTRIMHDGSIMADRK